MMKQVDAVYGAIVSVLAESGVEFKDGTNVATVLTKEMRGQVTTILMSGFAGKSIELKREPFATDAALRVYVTGLISNWLRKDERLNGGEKYVPKNPGSRFGSSDSELTALRALLKTVGTDAERIEIQGFIEARTSAIKAANPKTVAINYGALPAELAAKYAK